MGGGWTAKSHKGNVWGNGIVLYLDYSGGYIIMHLSKLIEMYKKGEFYLMQISP